MSKLASPWLIPVADFNCLNLFKIPLNWGTPPLNEASVANPVWRDFLVIVTQTASEFLECKGRGSGAQPRRLLLAAPGGTQGRDARGN